jgi:hypothetical protein
LPIARNFSIIASVEPFLNGVCSSIAVLVEGRRDDASRVPGRAEENGLFDLASWFHSDGFILAKGCSDGFILAKGCDIAS